jgi:hypothetical protein
MLNEPFDEALLHSVFDHSFEASYLKKTKQALFS